MAISAKLAETVIDVDLTLRTQQIQYLEYLCDRDDVPIGGALGLIIDEFSSKGIPQRTRPARKVRKHVLIQKAHLVVIDQLSVLRGLTRSEIVRRLIDAALSRDNTL